jgi:hypothetical protein
MQKIRLICMTVTVGLFLLLLSCCKQPVQPVVEPPLNFDEPDTIKSFVSFTLTAPGWYSYKWDLKKPLEIIGEGFGISFHHNIISKSCNLFFLKQLEFAKQTVTRPYDTTMYTLRSWRSFQTYKHLHPYSH